MEYMIKLYRAVILLDVVLGEGGLFFSCAGAVFCLSSLGVVKVGEVKGWPVANDLFVVAFVEVL